MMASMYFAVNLLPKSLRQYLEYIKRSLEITAKDNEVPVCEIKFYLYDIK